MMPFQGQSMNPLRRCLLLAILAVAALAGCADEPLRQPVDLPMVAEGHGLIVVYRVDERQSYSHRDGSGPVVRIDEVATLPLRRGFWVERSVEPGAVRVELPGFQRDRDADPGRWRASRTVQLVLKVRAGETRFIELRLRNDGRFSFSEVAPEQALPELELLRPQR